MDTQPTKEPPSNDKDSLMTVMAYAAIIIPVAILILVGISQSGSPEKTVNSPTFEPPKPRTKEEIATRLKIFQEEERQKEAELKAWYKTKAGKINKKHQEWSREDCKLLADNRIWIGMSLDMLKYKRGLPNHANPSNYGRGTQWQWCWDDYSPSCFYDNDDDGLIDSYN